MDQHILELEDIGKIRSLLEMVFEGSPLYGDASAEEAAIRKLREITGGMVILVPEDTFDVAIAYEPIWYHGRFLEHEYANAGIEFPIQTTWVVNVRVAKLPVLFVHRNKFRIPDRNFNVLLDNSAHQRRRLNVPKSYRWSNCYLDDIWNPVPWLDSSVISGSCPEAIRLLMDGKLIAPIREFQCYPDVGPYLLSPLIPSKVSISLLSITKWGVFRECRVERTKSLVAS
jgi:hypothetical protein